MEYHSFLLAIGMDYIEDLELVGFRLLMEYHSFLSVGRLMYEIIQILKFPSPYGVSFILIINRNFIRYNSSNRVSVSLWSIIHSYMNLR